MVSWIREPPKEFRALGRLNWGLVRLEGLEYIGSI